MTTPAQEFEAVIGLEVHVQLATESKLFCGCRVRLEEGRSVADEQVNGNTCEICTAQPGTLPVLNKQSVEYAIRAGLATGCKVNPRSVFARKNYFYPDLPKGYQISQHNEPLCEHGGLEIELKDGSRKKVRIQRIHMEEDAGKNVHMADFSIVNLNRAGVPLIEIVSEPDMRTPEEAGAYLRAIHAIVTYTGVSEGNMQEGHLRCDANVSVRPKGQKEFGTRAEIKNVNSFRFVEKAIEYEIARQISVVQSGGKVVQETRLYDSQKNTTQSMRSKEEAHDYRYFPEPDLVPLVVEDAWVERVRNNLPELPHEKRERYVSEFGLSRYDAGVLTASASLAVFFQDTMKLVGGSGEQLEKSAKTVANLLTGEVSRLLNEGGIEIRKSRLKPQHIADLATLLQENVLSSSNAKRVIVMLWENDGDVRTIVDQEGLKQVSDAGALEKLVDEVVAKNPQQVEQFKAGKEKLIGFFVGQAMKASQGQANPAVLQELLMKKLKS